MPYQPGYIYEPNASSHQPARHTPYHNYDELVVRINELFTTPAAFHSWLLGPDVDLDNFFFYVAEPHMVEQLRQKPLVLVVLNRYCRTHIEHKGNIIVSDDRRSVAVYYRSRMNYMVLMPEWVQRFVLEGRKARYTSVREIVRVIEQLLPHYPG